MVGSFGCGRPDSVGSAEAAAPAAGEAIFPHPFQDIEADYQVGGKFTFIRIGLQPKPSKDGKDNLDGNFGVFYTIKALIENPNPQPAEVEVVFEASAGYSGAVVLVDGQVVKTPVLKPKGEYRLAVVRLEPEARRSLYIQTMPLSGGSYPATLAIRPVGSNARYGTTPPSERRP